MEGKREMVKMNEIRGNRNLNLVSLDMKSERISSGLKVNAEETRKIEGRVWME